MASSQFAPQILAEIRQVLDRDETDAVKLTRLWIVLCHRRAELLGLTLRNTVGPTVQSGPFKSMQLTPDAMTNIFAPMLLGTWEHELHPAVEQAIATPYQHVLNIGSSYGYYAVGFARRMPQTQVHAFDTAPGMAEKCIDMARLNGVETRLQTAGLFRGEDFAAFAGQRTLVFMDAEGAELDLLDPQKYPALRQMDIIVEMHEVFNASLPATLLERFGPSHDVEKLVDRHLLFDFSPIVGDDIYIDPIDSFLANWENRGGPTPWGVFRAKSHP